MEVPPLPAKYFRQFQKKVISPKPKAPIEEGIKAEDILDRMLEGEMTVTPKELWAIAPKLWTALKEILTSRRTSTEEKELPREQPRLIAETSVVKIDRLWGPLAIQAKIEVAPGEKTELWTMKDLVVQFLETLHPSERAYQVFMLEECVREESAPEMAHLRVVLVLVNGVTEEEALLDSGSQIVSMMRDVAAANKISWDPGLSI